MEGLNNKNNNFIIGNKIFSLTEVKNSEEYLVEIIIPEIDDEQKAAAYIKAKIILTWNDKNYEKKKERLEIKINKIKASLSKAEDYLRKIRHVYEKLKKIKKTKIKNNLPDLDVFFNNRKKETIKKKYIVEFNNEKGKEEIKDDESIEDKNKEKEIKEEKEKDVKEENNKDIEIKDPENIKEEVIENKKEEKTEIKEVQEDVMKEDINDEKMKENDVKKEEKEEVNESDIKEEKDNIKEAKEIEIKEPEEKYIQETAKETIDYESLISQVEKNNENNNIYKTEKYNEIINPNIQYNTNINPISNEQLSNKKEEYLEINIDDYINNNNSTVDNISTNYDVYQNQNQINNNYINTNNILNAQNLSQSINKAIVTQNTLPVIIKKSVHKVIYDSNVKTLPLIFGGTKVTYLKNNESIDYINNNIIGNNNIPLSKTQIVTPVEDIYKQNAQVQTITQKNPIQSYNQVKTTNNTISQIENELKNNLSQSYTLQEYPIQTYNQTQTQTHIKENPAQKLNQINKKIQLNTQQNYNQTYPSYTQNNPIVTFNPIQKEIKVHNAPTYNQTQIYTQGNNVQNYEQILNRVQNYSQISNNTKINPIHTYEQKNQTITLNKYIPKFKHILSIIQYQISVLFKMIPKEIINKYIII